MTVSVDSRRLADAEHLHKRALLALDFVEEGRNWLDWAIGDPEKRYHFRDEEDLVGGIQTGLHANPLLLIPSLGLSVSPVKLMTLSEAELGVLALARGRTGERHGHLARARHILQANGLITATDLLSVDSYLEELGIPREAPLFQALSFDEKAALFSLFRRLPDDEPMPVEFHREAALFAIEEARAPLEWIDYFKAYLGYIGRVGELSQGTEKRMNLARVAVRTVRPLLFDALDCPRVDRRVAEAEVYAILNRWLADHRLGFSRLSEGVQQVLSNTSYGERRREAPEEIVDSYLEGAEQLLRLQILEAGPVAQDGASRLFTGGDGTEEVEVELGADGLITLRSYRRSNDEEGEPDRGQRHRKHRRRREKQNGGKK